MIDQISLLNSLLEKTKKAGADLADAICINNSSLSVSTRMNNVEGIERQESTGIGLRVIINNQQALVSTTNLANLDDLVVKAIDMAKHSPKDPYLSFAEVSLLASNIPDLQLSDDFEPDVNKLLNLAKEMEQVGLSYQGITNSGGASASFMRNQIALATSNGFANSYNTSNSSISISLIAGDNDNMETDYDYSNARFMQDLSSTSEVAMSAAKRTVGKLNSRKPKSIKAPVVFEPRVAKILLNNFISAINGSTVARGTSFLKNDLGQQLLPSLINIVDDPLIIKGHNSRPFDLEGLAVSKKYLVKDGILENWITDLRSAKQLGTHSSANASRGLSMPPYPAVSNCYITPGKLSERELIENISNGLYVTNMFGVGINIVTGDFSQGATGFWIENGEIKYPVNEITIAGNLRDMFKNLVAANNLEFKSAVNSPSLMIESMTIAGA